MLIRYSLSGSAHELRLSGSDDLAVLCAEAEERLQAEHTELTGQPYLAEKITDGVLNGLASDNLEADLGELVT